MPGITNLPCEYNLTPLLDNVDPLRAEGPKILEVYSAKVFFLANFYQPFLLFTFIYFTLNILQKGKN